MKDSIVIDMKYADYDMIDGSYGVERHHLMGGANRNHADEDGLWVPLSPEVCKCGCKKCGEISIEQLLV